MCRCYLCELFFFRGSVFWSSEFSNEFHSSLFVFVSFFLFFFGSNYFGTNIDLNRCVRFNHLCMRVISTLLLWSIYFFFCSIISIYYGIFFFFSIFISFALNWKYCVSMVRSKRESRDRKWYRIDKEIEKQNKTKQKIATYNSPFTAHWFSTPLKTIVFIVSVHLHSQQLTNYMTAHPPRLSPLLNGILVIEEIFYFWTDGNTASQTKPKMNIQKLHFYHLLSACRQSHWNKDRHIIS